MRHIIFVFVLIAWMPFWAGILPESDAGGQVKEIQGETIRFLADSEFQPVAGDRIEIYVEVPGVGPAVVATAVVTGVEGDHMLAKVERNIGKISAGQKIRAAASGSPITPPKSDVRRTPERAVDQPPFAVVPFSTEEATRFRASWTSIRWCVCRGTTRGRSVGGSAARKGRRIVFPPRRNGNSPAGQAPRLASAPASSAQNCDSLSGDVRSLLTSAALMFLTTDSSGYVASS
jgi:hypothetical protein